MKKNKVLEVDLTEDDYDAIFDGLVELRQRNIDHDKAQAVLTKLKKFIFAQ